MNKPLTRASLAALFALGALGSSATAAGLAGGSTPLDPPDWPPAATPRVIRIDSTTLELRGAPGERLLLLYGALDAGDAGRGGRRVRPERVLELFLDPGGRATLGDQAVERRTFVQAWQRRGAVAGPWGSFSPPVTLLPGGGLPGVRLQGGGQEMSVALPGDLAVTEFMKDPAAVSDSHGEWIELVSNKPWRLDIEGVTVSDFSGASFTLDNGGAGILLAPGQRYVLGNDDDPLTNGGVPVDWKWSGFSLKNSADEIIVTSAAGQYLDVVAYDDGDRWPDASGKSISLTQGVTDSFSNDDPSLWCEGVSAIAGGADLGTPGAPNDLCP